MVLMPRDPEWLYVYWDVPPDRLADAAQSLGVDVADLQLALRVHDVTDAVAARVSEPMLGPATQASQTEVAAKDDHWYVKGGRPEGAYCVEYVALAPDGRAAAVVTSNIASTPADHVAPRSTEQWVQPGPSGLESAESPEADGGGTWEQLLDQVHDCPGSSASPQ
jgi:hypothetical protein